MRVRDGMLNTFDFDGLRTGKAMFWLCALTLGVGPVSVASLGAQAGTAPAKRRVPVTVVISDGLAAHAPFVIHRRPDSDPRDVIVLKRDATALDLADAIRVLLSSRAIAGDTSQTRVILRRRPDQKSGVTARQYPWVPRVLGDLRRAEHKDIPHVGRVPAIEIWLPPQPFRGTRGPAKRSL